MEAIDDQTEPWGIKVTIVAVKEVELLPVEMISVFLERVATTPQQRGGIVDTPDVPAAPTTPLDISEVRHYKR